MSEEERARRGVAADKVKRETRKSRRGTVQLPKASGPAASGVVIRKASKALEAALSATEQRATATETRNELLQAAAAEHAQPEQGLRSELESLRKALEAAAAEHVGMSPRKEVERLRGLR